MSTQSQIRRTLGAAAVERVAGILSVEQFASWSAPERRIRAEFD